MTGTSREAEDGDRSGARSYTGALPINVAAIYAAIVPKPLCYRERHS